MSEMNPIEREQKKKQLRGRVIDTATQDMFPRRGISHGENEEEVAEKAERHSRRKRLRRVLTAVLIAALLAAGFMYYKDNHAYTDYTCLLYTSWYPSSRMVCGALRTGKRRSRWNSSAAV